MHSWVRSKEVFYTIEVLPPNLQPINTPDTSHSTYSIDRFTTMDVNAISNFPHTYHTINPIGAVTASASFSNGTRPTPAILKDSGKRSKSSDQVWPINS